MKSFYHKRLVPHKILNFVPKNAIMCGKNPWNLREFSNYFKHNPFGLCVLPPLIHNLDGKKEKIMKKLLFAIFTAAVMAMAQATDGTAPANSKPSLDTHSGIYVDLGLGASLTAYTYDNSEFLDFSNYLEENIFGMGPSANVKVGWLFSNLVTAHASLAYSRANGTLEIIMHGGLFGSTTESSYDVKIQNMFLGAGATFFPFRKPKSIMKGFYVGADIGYNIMQCSNDENIDYRQKNMTWRIETGKAWHVSENVLLGIGGIAAIGYARDAISGNFGLEAKVIYK